MVDDVASTTVPAALRGGVVVVGWVKSSERPPGHWAPLESYRVLTKIERMMKRCTDFRIPLSLLHAP
jgi:hypothetical protein